MTRIQFRFDMNANDETRQELEIELALSRLLREQISAEIERCDSVIRGHLKAIMQIGYFSLALFIGSVVTTLLMSLHGNPAFLFFVLLAGLAGGQSFESFWYVRTQRQELRRNFSQPSPEPQEDEAYQAYIAECAKDCHCEVDGPCDGVLAGGPCDRIKDRRDDRDEDEREWRQYDRE